MLRMFLPSSARWPQQQLQQQLIVTGKVVLVLQESSLAPKQNTFTRTSFYSVDHPSPAKQSCFEEEAVAIIVIITIQQSSMSIPGARSFVSQKI